MSFPLSAVLNYQIRNPPNHPANQMNSINRSHNNLIIMGVSPPTPIFMMVTPTNIIRNVYNPSFRGQIINHGPCLVGGFHQHSTGPIVIIGSHQQPTRPRVTLESHQQPTRPRVTLESHQQPTGPNVVHDALVLVDGRLAIRTVNKSH
jgi:hypothetical protein